MKDYSNRFSFFSPLLVWDIAYSYDTFDYFLHHDFKLENQKKCKDEKIFNQQEFELLLEIYNAMRVYFDNCEDIWRIDINSTEVKKIKVTVDEFLSLESLKPDLEDYEKLRIQHEK